MFCQPSPSPGATPPTLSMACAANAVGQGVVDRHLRHADPDVARGAEGHHRAEGDAHVAVDGEGDVAPAAGVVLALDRELDGLLELVAHAGVAAHAVDLRHRER